MAGRLEIICGPMFSGKTTELLRRLSCDSSVGLRTLLVSHSNGRRVEGSFPGHDPKSDAILSCSVPSPEDAGECVTVGIDEAQFFDDLEGVLGLVGAGKRVVVAGLIGDAERRPFGRMGSLLPHAESLCFLQARCVLCPATGRCGASFTRRFPGAGKEQVLVGGRKEYFPVCREHFQGPPPRQP